MSSQWPVAAEPLQDIQARSPPVRKYLSIREKCRLVHRDSGRPDFDSALCRVVQAPAAGSVQRA